MLRPRLVFILAGLVPLVGCADDVPTAPPAVTSSLPTIPATSPPSSLFPVTKILVGCLPDPDAPGCSPGSVVLSDGDGTYTLHSDTAYTLELDLTKPPPGSCQTYRLTFSWLPYPAYPWPCGAPISFWQGLYIPRSPANDQRDERITLVVSEYGPDSSVTRSESRDIVIHVRD